MNLSLGIAGMSAPLCPALLPSSCPDFHSHLSVPHAVAGQSLVGAGVASTAPELVPGNASSRDSAAFGSWGGGGCEPTLCGTAGFLFWQGFAGRGKREPQEAEAPNCKSLLPASVLLLSVMPVLCLHSWMPL